MTDLTEAMLDQALSCARCGWPVFPCRPGAKAPATRHGFRDATTDETQIRTWWRHLPDANVAVATGLPGPDVLDVDQHGPAGNGFAAYRELLAAGLFDDSGTVVATPGGGLHAYFTGSEQRSARLPRHHLDFRSTGGYVLVPPSQVGGRRYQLVRRGRQPVGLTWSVVTSLLEPQREWPGQRRCPDVAVTSRLPGWVERLEPGNRHSGLFWAACRAVEAGQQSLLDDLAAAAAKAGLPDQEISRTIASARRSAHIP